MLNTTTTNINFNHNCQSEDMKFYISLAVNVGLLIVTTISEFMGASKCSDSNGIVHGIHRTLSQTKDLIENNDLSNNLNV